MGECVKNWGWVVGRPKWIMVMYGRVCKENDLTYLVVKENENLLYFLNICEYDFLMQLGIQNYNFFIREEN